MIDFEYDDFHCDLCAMDFYDLIEKLISDIQLLEPKTVYLRYLLSKHLPQWDGEMLRSDIFNDLAGRYWDLPAYKKYMSDYCGGIDPFDLDEYNDLMWCISRGRAIVGL